MIRVENSITGELIEAKAEDERVIRRWLTDHHFPAAIAHSFHLRINRFILTDDNFNRLMESLRPYDEDNQD